MRPLMILVAVVALAVVLAWAPRAQTVTVHGDRNLVWLGG
ncbi:hypothetical protein GGD88_003537 [Roseospira goensis]|uniref:Uncharacterized protein n=1 Tax=Roseospira goensis TaxID=391922 RepID=A0A7W6WMA5_9PROT|nr:hypothetical protein [Roseospira goensis]MBB4287780.1 hypothetical protein [Roseospira goensis]